MRWNVHAEEPLYTDEWLDIRHADIELPDGRHLDHRLIRTPPGAGAVVTDSRRRVLLLWRHRFITDLWGWEIPIGKIDAEEPPIDAAAREVEEETGWRPEQLDPLLFTTPSPGLLDSAHHIFHTDTATYTGPPAEAFEAERIAWIPLVDISDLIDKRNITSGTTIAALLYYLSRR